MLAVLQDLLALLASLVVLAREENQAPEVLLDLLVLLEREALRDHKDLEGTKETLVIMAREDRKVTEALLVYKVFQDPLVQMETKEHQVSLDQAGKEDPLDPWARLEERALWVSQDQWDHREHVD